MTIEPNKLFLEYLQRVLPLFTDKFSDKISIFGCGINLDGSFYIDVNPNIKERVGNNINITKLLFAYNYNEYKVLPKAGGVFELQITKNTIDKQIIKDNFFFINQPNNFINQGYYSVSNVIHDTLNNKTMIYINLGQNIKYFDIKNSLTLPSIELYTDYGNTFYGYNGLKEIKKIEDVTISNVNYKRITLTKDDGFNFVINPVNFVCLYANLHCNLARIVHAIPNEFQEYRLSEYIQSKENVLLVNIANARTDDGSFDYYTNKSKQVYIPMRYTLEMYIYLYRNLYNDNEIQVASIYDNISDVMHEVCTKIITVCALYKETLAQKINNKSIGGIQNMSSVVTPNIRHIGNIRGNMETYLITMDVEGSIFAFDSNILKEQSMIKQIQGNIIFDTFKNL